MGSEPNASPRITHLAWGQMDVDGLGRGKDFKLWPGGGRHWDWNETGTRHDPGILPEDLLELLEHGSREIVLSRGMQLRLKTSSAAMVMLEQHGLPVHIAETGAAVALYNRLAASGIAVGGLFHSTC